MITQERVKELFEYHDGGLYWKVSKSPIKSGQRIGSISTGGYRRAEVDGNGYQEHRLIYLMFHGDMPEFIDHIDNDQSNNSIENLRPCTKLENNLNSRIRIDNTSGIKGVHWDKCSKKWKAQLSISGKRKHLGLFDDISVAAEAVRSAREKHHGEFARHE